MPAETMQNLWASLIFLGSAGVAIGMCAITRILPFTSNASKQVRFFVGMGIGFILFIMGLTWLVSHLAIAPPAQAWLLPTIYIATLSGLGSGLLWTLISLMIHPPKQAGFLILKTGRFLPSAYQMALFLGIGLALPAVVRQTQGAIAGLTAGFSSSTIPALVVLNACLGWSFVLSLWLFATSKLEIRAYGISFGGLRLIPWHAVIAYGWEINGVRVQWIEDSNAMHLEWIAIPAKYRLAVEAIFLEHLPERPLKMAKPL